MSVFLANVHARIEVHFVLSSRRRLAQIGVSIASSVSAEGGEEAIEIKGNETNACGGHC